MFRRATRAVVTLLLAVPLVVTQAGSGPGQAAHAAGNDCSNGVAGEWNYHSTVSEQDGLVVYDTKLDGRLAVRSMQVAYIKVTTQSGGKEATNVVRLRMDGALQEGGLSSRLLPQPGEAGPSYLCDPRTTSATYLISGLPNAATLTVDLTYRFQDVQPGDQCEPSGKVPCGRFWPTLSWRTSAPADGGVSPVTSVKTAQRLDFRPDDAPKGSAMILGDALNPSTNPGVVAREVLREVRAPAIIRGWGIPCGRLTISGPTCTIDNYHQSPGSMVAMPGNYGTAGCPECIHMHWRWSPLTNGRAYYDEWRRHPNQWPAGATFTDGRTAVLPGSPQNAWLSVVAEHLDRDETHPRAVSTLVGDDEMVKGGHPIVFWETESAGIPQSDGTRLEATFPYLPNALPGDRGSLWVNPDAGLGMSDHWA